MIFSKGHGVRVWRVGTKTIKYVESRGEVTKKLLRPPQLQDPSPEQATNNVIT